MGFNEAERVRETSKATGYELLALMMLALRVNDKEGTGAAWPSVETFANDANCTERFIQKIVKGWRENPHEVYVIDGGGRFNPNRYVILVGCGYAEIVRRLMVNLNINQTQAETLASKCGYEKGVAMDTVTQEKGEHYDIKRVNNETTKGEHYAERVLQCSPEKELEKELEPEKGEKEFNSLHPTSAESPQPTPTATNEDGKIIPFSQDFDLTLNAVMELCALEGENSRKRARRTLRKLAAMTPAHEVPPCAKDFIRFRYYMQAVNAQPKPPTLAYLEDGWGRFLEWHTSPYDWTVRYWNAKGWPKDVPRDRLVTAHDAMDRNPLLMEVG